MCYSIHNITIKLFFDTVFALFVQNTNQNNQTQQLYKEGEDMAMSDDQRFAMYTAEEIGNAIKKRRRQLKITQKEFAERLGKSERTIQKYESGEITMKIDLIKQVADELDIPWQELLEAKTDKIGIVAVEDNAPAYRFHT